jgi:hypothetical protein
MNSLYGNVKESAIKYWKNHNPKNICRIAYCGSDVAKPQKFQIFIYDSNYNTLTINFNLKKEDDNTI